MGWSATSGRPAGHLRSCSDLPVNVPSLGRTSPAPEPVGGAASRLNTDGSRGGRPAAKYCSGACRTAAHRALHRTLPATAAVDAGHSHATNPTYERDGGIRLASSRRTAVVRQLARQLCVQVPPASSRAHRVMSLAARRIRQTGVRTDLPLHLRQVSLQPLRRERGLGGAAKSRGVSGECRVPLSDR